MSTEYDRTPASEMQRSLNALRGNWALFVLLGMVLLCLGAVALGSVFVASLATALVIGLLMLIGGFAEIIGSFWSRAWSGFFLHLLSGVLSSVVGLLFLRAPLRGLLALTLLVACLLMVGGIVKIVGALSIRFAAWGWPLVSGIVDVTLGVMVWQEWPESALWVIGLYIGVSLIFRGFNWIALGLLLRTVRSPESRM